MLHQIKQLTGKASTLAVTSTDPTISEQLTSLYADLDASLATIGLSVACSVLVSQLYVFVLSVDIFRGCLRKMAIVQVALCGKFLFLYFFWINPIEYFFWIKSKPKTIINLQSQFLSILSRNK